MSDDRKITVKAADVEALKRFWYERYTDHEVLDDDSEAIDRIIAAYEEQTTPPWEPTSAAVALMQDWWESAPVEAVASLRWMHDRGWELRRIEP